MREVFSSENRGPQGRGIGVLRREGYGGQCLFDHYSNSILHIARGVLD